MSKLTPAHLPPFAKLVEGALREGAISVEDVKEFSDAVFTAALEQQVRRGGTTYGPKLTPGGNSDGKIEEAA